MEGIQRIVDNLVRNEILACQSSLVDMLIEDEVEGFGVDDIEWAQRDACELEFYVWLAGNNSPGYLPDESYHSHESAKVAWGALFDSMEAYLDEATIDSEETIDELQQELEGLQRCIDREQEGSIQFMGRAWEVTKGTMVGEDLKKSRSEPLYWNPFDDGFESVDGIDEEELEAYPEILEWWLVTSWMAERLKEQGETILDNDYGIWWGRSCSGQSITCDGVIRSIAEGLNQ